MADEQSIEGLASSVRKRLGLSQPPVDPVEALGAFQLSMPPEPLESILAAAGLSQDQISKVDAMLDLQDECVYVRDGMHDRKKNWATCMSWPTVLYRGTAIFCTDAPFSGFPLPY